MATKTETRQLKDLKDNLFVRTGLNQDHALFLAGLVENGEELAPIEINKHDVIIDGRHRREAYDLNKRTEIRCVVVDVEDETELIGRAYKANLGGSLPPTREDTEHTISLLLGHGLSVKAIGEMLGLPPGMARQYIGVVKSKMDRAKLLDAVRAITDAGITAPAAAEKYKVDLDKLKDMLGGKRRQHKEVGVTAMQRSVTFRFKSLSSSNAAMLRKLWDGVEDGDITLKQAREVMEHLHTVQKKSAKAVSDWETRFETKFDSKAAKQA